MNSKKRQPVLLQIAQLGNPVIGKKSKSVDNSEDKNFQELIDNMIGTCLDVNGVGIAAPQVYKPVRLFIVASQPNSRYPDAPKMKPLAIINPRIIAFSKTSIEGWEGCLSVPSIRGFVARHSYIAVEYTTREGKKAKKTFKGFVARIFQHEYDHIEGKVFLDRVQSTKNLISEKEYQKMIRSTNKQNGK